MNRYTIRLRKKKTKLYTQKLNSKLNWKLSFYIFLWGHFFAIFISKISLFIENQLHSIRIGEKCSMNINAMIESHGRLKIAISNVCVTQHIFMCTLLPWIFIWILWSDRLCVNIEIRFCFYFSSAFGLFIFILYKNRLKNLTEKKRIQCIFQHPLWLAQKETGI